MADASLALACVYGISSDVASNLVNLSDGQKDRVGYAAAHTAVIFDKHTGTQTFLQVRRHKGSVGWSSAPPSQAKPAALMPTKHMLLTLCFQGHCNAITAMQATADRLLLITADAGQKPSLLVVWDPATGQPVSTVHQPHAAGVLSMAVSTDGKQLATLSAPSQHDSDEATQEVSVCVSLTGSAEEQACLAEIQAGTVPPDTVSLLI